MLAFVSHLTCKNKPNDNKKGLKNELFLL